MALSPRPSSRIIILPSGWASRIRSSWLRTGRAGGGGLLASGWLLAAIPLAAIPLPTPRPPASAARPGPVPGAPINLLDSKLSYWYKWLGVPYPGLTGLPAGTPIGDGLHGTPLGRQDPKNVFSVRTIAGEPVLCISGEMLGALTSNQEYANFHLRLQYKWGTKKYPPRPLTRPRDSGFLYHLSGRNEDAYWSVFMLGLECQISQGTSGDLLYMTNKDSTLIPTVVGRAGPGNVWNRQAPPERVVVTTTNPKFHRSANYESDSTAWTTMEVYALGRAGVHLVNGHVVLAYQDAGIQQPDGTIRPLSKGKILIQSEGAEVYYKNITIQAITEIPAAIRQAAGLPDPARP